MSVPKAVLLSLFTLLLYFSFGICYPCFNAPSTGEDEFAQEWAAVFGGAQAGQAGDTAQLENEGSQQFLPSNLLETQLAGMASGNNGIIVSSVG